MSAGHVVEVVPGRWQLRVYKGKEAVTGRKIWHTKVVDAANRTTAEEALAEFFVDHRSVTGAVGIPTVGQLLDEWYEATDWAGAEYNTRIICQTTLAGLRDRKVRDVTTRDLNQFYAALRKNGGGRGTPYKASYMRRIHSVVRSAFEQAVVYEYRRDNPAVRANPGREPRTRITPPTRDQVLAILAAAATKDPDWLCYFTLAADTGARRAEIAAHRLSDFDGATARIDRDLIIVPADEAGHGDYLNVWPSRTARGKLRTALAEKATPKNTDSERTVALSPLSVHAVAAQRNLLTERFAAIDMLVPADAFLFPSDLEATRPLRPDTWDHRFARLRIAADVPATVRFHDVRHYVATALITSGVDLAHVAGRLGHGGGGKTTLAIYAAFLKEPDEAAAAVMASLLAADHDPTPTSNVIAIDRRRRHSVLP